MNQSKLSNEQIMAFYHEEFVEDQVRDFRDLVGEGRTKGAVVDIGGGCGFFAKRLAVAAGERTRVIDTDNYSVEECAKKEIEAFIGDALEPEILGDEEVVTFNLILHHLVGDTERKTRELQKKAISSWHMNARYIFVNEYIYESYVGNLSGALIYRITSNRILSYLGRLVSRIIPAFRANTFGVGVRFRSNEEWKKLFSECNLRVVDSRIGAPEHIALPLRALLIKEIRRDSFLLEGRNE